MFNRFPGYDERRRYDLADEMELKTGQNRIYGAFQKQSWGKLRNRLAGIGIVEKLVCEICGNPKSDKQDGSTRERMFGWYRNYHIRLLPMDWARWIL